MIMTQAASSPPCHRVGEPSERPEESSGRHQRTEDLTGGERNIIVNKQESLLFTTWKRIVIVQMSTTTTSS